MEMKPYIVYVKLDDASRIMAINSSAFLPNTEGWTEIDSGFGDRYHHAQGNYFDKPICDERGVCRYKLADGQPVERSTEEMDKDWSAPEETPVGSTSDTEKRLALLEEQNAALTQCLLKMCQLASL